MSDETASAQWARLWSQIQALAQAQGLAALGVSEVDLRHAEPHLQRWLSEGLHGEMDYMARHGLLRARPSELHPGCVRALSVRMDYLPPDSDPLWRSQEWERLDQPDAAYVSLYARGRDYHKVLKQRLQALSKALSALIGPLGGRVFCDSAPVLEVELAQKAGLGWRGKHTLLLNREAGSLFFLAEILIDCPLPPSQPVSAHCGQCTRCIDVCPTQAIVAPYWLDARKCISYLTIEHKGAIPVPLRAAIGNRIYGCDDCQLVCPWNKFAQVAVTQEFQTRPHFRRPSLRALFAWDEATFLKNTEGSAIRRIGHERWQRNLAVAMGNALRSATTPADEKQRIRQDLLAAMPGVSALVAEHVAWALESDEPEYGASPPTAQGPATR